MADNETTGTGKAIATRKGTYSGDANQNLQIVGLATVAGADDAKTLTDIDSTNRLPVAAGGITVTVEATITRPADTIAYAADDEISSSTSAPAVVTLTSCARASGGSGVIADVVLIDSNGVTGYADLELWIFDTTTTPNNDNTAFAPSDAVSQTLVGWVPLTLTAMGGGANRIYRAAPGYLPIPFVTVGSANLFARLLTRNAYTPISAETFKVRLKILQD